MNELNNSCPKEEGCLNASNIAIKEWSMSDKGSTPLGWVDALTLNAKLSGQKLKDANHLINFLMSSQGYLLALVPDWGDAPRYLLPAYKQYYSSQPVLDAAPLYHELYPLAERIKSVTAEGISPNLRLIVEKPAKLIGKKLDGYLQK